MTPEVLNWNKETNIDLIQLFVSFLVDETSTRFGHYELL